MNPCFVENELTQEQFIFFTIKDKAESIPFILDEADVFRVTP